VITFHTLSSIQDLLVELESLKERIVFLAGELKGLKEQKAEVNISSKPVK
jgi:hypothetical protein